MNITVPKDATQPVVRLNKTEQAVLAKAETLARQLLHFDGSLDPVVANLASLNRRVKAGGRYEPQQATQK